MNHAFANVIKNLPHKAGVYRYYSSDGLLLYVGKAKNLKNRVSSYFQEGRGHNERLSLMISQIHRIEYTVVTSEKEALILEANLIHSQQPKYNVLLKDDKNYLYVRVTDNDYIPGFFLTRRKYDPRSTYFGPYTKTVGIADTLRVLRTIFPYCQERKITGKACSYVSIKQCEGICAGDEKREDYIAKIEQIKHVLSGKTDIVETWIQTKISRAVDAENYELANLWKVRLHSLKETIQDQKIILPHPQDIDLVSLVTEKDTSGLVIGSIFLQQIRDGKVINVNNFLLTGTSDQQNDATLFMQRFLLEYSSKQHNPVPVLIQAHTK